MDNYLFFIWLARWYDQSFLGHVCGQHSFTSNSRKVLHGMVRFVISCFESNKLNFDNLLILMVKVSWTSGSSVIIISS